eukprot:scaffold153144_cov20-Prasinocladus_malaysianus.AAC.1
MSLLVAPLGVYLKKLVPSMLRCCMAFNVEFASAGPVVRFIVRLTAGCPVASLLNPVERSAGAIARSYDVAPQRGALHDAA